MTNSSQDLLAALTAFRGVLSRHLAIAFVLLAPVALKGADLLIHLPADASITRKTVRYQCDAKGPEIGVPVGAFPVEYINGGGNSLVVVPISGNSLIFSNVFAGSGARYSAQQYTWWEARGSVTLYSDSLTGKIQSSCHVTDK